MRNRAYPPPSTPKGKRRAARKARDKRKKERRQWAAAATEKCRVDTAAEETVVEDCTSEDDFPQHPGPFLDRLDGYPYDYIGADEVSELDLSEEDCDLPSSDPVTAEPEPGSRGLVLRLRGGAGPSQSAAVEKTPNHEHEAMDLEIDIDSDPVAASGSVFASAGLVMRLRGGVSRGGIDKKAKAAERKRNYRANMSAGQADAEKAANAASKKTRRVQRDPSQEEAEKLGTANRMRMHRGQRNASEIAADKKKVSELKKLQYDKEKADRVKRSRTKPGRSKNKGSSSRSTPKAQLEMTVNDFHGEGNFPEDVQRSDYVKKDHAMVAVWEYHIASGLVDERLSSIDDLKAPTAAQKLAAVKSFRRAVGSDVQRKGCAGCGQVFKISDLTPKTLGKPETVHLIQPPAYQTEYHGLSAVGQSARNVFPLHDNLYAVAPDLVDEKTKVVMICAPCAEKQPKAHSQFLDFDFGRPEPSMRLNPLSELNRLVIQSHVLYAVVVKMTNSKGRVESCAVRSHTFASSTDGPSRVGGGLNTGVNEGCLKHFSVVFIGSGDNFKALKKVLGDTTGSCIIPAARMDVEQTARLLNYLKQARHPDYVDISVPPLDELGRVLQGLSEKASDDVIVEDGSLAAFAEGGMENPEDGASILNHEPRPDTSAAASVQNVVKAVEGAKSKGGTSPPKTDHVPITVDPELSNEYTSMHRVLGGVFPFEFPLGVPEAFAKGGFPDRVKQRLLLCYTGAYEKLPLFNFALFSTGQRMAVNKVAISAPKSSTYSFRKFKEALSSPQVMSDLKKAVDNLSGPEATRILRDIAPLIRNASPKLAWSPSERQNEIYKIYALCQRFGLPGIFLTVSKESCTSPIVVSVGSRDLDAPMRTVWDSSTAFSRLKAVQSSPATCADEYDRVCRAVLTSLCGVELEGADKRKDEGVKAKVGIFGRLKALIAVTEAQTRGSLHMHAILWTRFGPTFFGRFVHDGVAHEKVTAWIDEIVSATLSEAMHAARKEKKTKKRAEPPVFPINPIELGEIEADGQEVASCFNFHDHRPRCRQGKVGCRQCAAARPQSLSDATCFTQVQTFVQKPKSKSTIPTDFDGQLYPIYDSENQNYLAAACPAIGDEPAIRPDVGEALPDCDGRILCLTLKRLCEDDQFVVEYNAVLSSMVKCNTAVIPLAAGEDARSSLMYLVKYLSKTPAKLTEVIPMLMAAKVAADKYPSVADNSGEPVRDATYVLAKLLNKLAGMQEYSLEQCAAANLGVPSSYCSEKMTYCHVFSSARAVRNLHEKRAFDDDGKDGDLNLSGPVPASDTESESGSEMDVDDIGSDVGSEMNVDDTNDDSGREMNLGDVGNFEKGARGSHTACENVDDCVSTHHIGSADVTAMDVDSGDNAIGANATPTIENADQDFDLPPQSESEKIDHIKRGFTSVEGGREVVFTKDKVTGEKEVKCVYQDENFFYRGEKFIEMSFLEYNSLVVRKDKTLVDPEQNLYSIPGKRADAAQEGSRPRGRPSNLVAEYDERHQLHFKSYQQLFSKSFTPILAGPPRPTAAMWHDKNTRNYFCTYYASLLVPYFAEPDGNNGEPRLLGRVVRDPKTDEIIEDHRHMSAQHYTTGPKFAELMEKWSSGASKVNFARYLTFVGMVTNMTSTARGRTGSAIFRSKSVVPWGHMDTADQPGFGPGSFNAKGKTKFNKESADAADAIMDSMCDEASGVVPKHVLARQAHLEDIVARFHGIVSQVNPIPAPVVKPKKGKKPPILYSNMKSLKPGSQAFTSEWHTDQVDALAKKKPGSPDDDLTGGDTRADMKNVDLSGEDLDLLNKQKKKATYKLNEGQLDVFELVTSKMLAKEQTLLVVTGDPGTGKTTVCGRFVDFLEDRHVRSLALSYMWSAVYQMNLNCPRMSIHKLLKASPDSLRIAKILREKQWNHTQWVATTMHGRDLLIIDEISTTNLSLLVALDTIMRLALDNDEPFGGVSVVLLGDFKQNRPTNGTTIATAAVRQSSGKARFGIQGRALTTEQMVEKAAAVLFVKFQRRELTEQMRAMDCEKQKAFLKRFDLSSTELPISDSILKSLPVFSNSLLEKDPLFEDAVYAVRTNMEKQYFNNMQVKRFAARYKLPVFVWDNKVLAADDFYCSTKGKDLYEQGVQEYRTYFTPGMPVILSQQVPGAHESWKLKNSPRGVAHSFSYKDSDSTKLSKEAFTSEGHGKEFYIPQPDFFNVLVFDMPGEKPSSKPTIVPVPLASDGGQGFIYYLKRTRKSKKDKYATHVAMEFPVDVGFAMTFEKIQGSTLDRIVLVISDLAKSKIPPLQLEKLFVAFSRVRELAHLAIFPAAPRDLSYLTTLTYDDDLTMWANNYDENGFWKTDIIISPTATGLFKRISPPQLSSLDTASRNLLQQLCREFGIYYAATDLPGLREKLRPLYARYLASRA